MQGRRVQLNEDGSVPSLQAGDYVKLQNGDWYGKTPNNESCNLKAHKTVEHEDGTITVSPSILIRALPQDGSMPIELWHGYLERGVWRSC